jgi:Putative Flp pilus-assembly TadE/G-like
MNHMARLGSDKQRKAPKRGMVAAQVALCLAPLCGVAAFAIDCGLLYENRRRAQASADSAALAAAQDLYANYPTNNGADPEGTASASARSTALANGFSNDGANSIVTVNIPPASGSFANRAGFAEVVVTYYQPRGFSGIFAGGGNIPVTGRAVARGLWTTYANGIILLDPLSSGALSDSGGGSVTVNGTATIDIDKTVSDSQFALNGSPADLVSANRSFVGSLEAGETPTLDPLAYLPAPDAASLSVQSNSKLSISGSGSTTLSPGTYVGGVAISGTGSVTLSPGVYYLSGGGLTASGSATVTGAGVMIYNSPGSIADVVSVTGAAAITLSPPTSGIYQGITLFQDRTSSAPISFTGNGGMTVDGTIYAAHAQLNLIGNNGSNRIGGQYIVNGLTLAGSGSVRMSWSSTATSHTRGIGLVE